jgi:hypothetical protein
MSINQAAVQKYLDSLVRKDAGLAELRLRIASVLAVYSNPVAKDSQR